MNAEPYIPAATVEKINGDHPVGSRHAAAIKIAMSLLGNGLPRDAVFSTLRAKFPPEKSDKELMDVVTWCEEKNPQPSGHGGNGRAAPARLLPAQPAPVAKPAKPPAEIVEWWTSGAQMTLEAFTAGSEASIPDDLTEAAILCLESLYAPQERLNVVCAHLVDAGKARPCGGGKTQPRASWVQYIRDHGIPQKEAGAWIRPNPVNDGTGKDGSITDADVAAHRFVLVESDVLSLPAQLALFHRLPLPISAVILSGGLSAHAWVKVDGDRKEFDRIAARLLALLAPFGVDQANKNPSRLSRFPGARRIIGGVDGGIQRLLRLKADAKPLTWEALDDFEIALQQPAIDEMPMRNIARRACGRYDELMANRGKLGIPTGITNFDIATGGLKGGQMITIAAETGGGKTTLAANIVSHACVRHDHGVALFTMEMDQDEIFDMLISMNYDVNRNAFNHGGFTEGEKVSMGRGMMELAQKPLWICDEAIITPEQIRARCVQLKREEKIALVVVDYLQFVTASGAFKDNREQQVAAISRSFRALAKELRLPVIVLSQLNDDGRIRESRVIAHDSHIVLIVQDDGENFVVKIQKGRSIPKADYLMRYDRQFCRLTFDRTLEKTTEEESQRKKWKR